MIAAGKPVINIGIGNPDLPPPNSAVKALQKASENILLQGYQAYKGIEPLRKAIAGFYKKHYSVSLNSESEILPLTGSKEGIMLISMAFLNLGEDVLIPNPGYSTYSSVTKLIGGNPVYYDLTPENNWLPDFETLEKLDLSKVKIMWVNYPHMPTGTVATIEMYKRLISFAKKHSILLVNDNPYSFILTDKPMSILQVENAQEVALELNSLSKTFNMAGWRVGMLLGNQKHIDAVVKVKSNMDSGMYYGLQSGAIAALNSDKSWFTTLNNTYRKRRVLIWKICNILGYTYDKNATGLFVWAKISNNEDSKKVTDYLLQEKHIFVTPGSIFGTNGKYYMRFSLCSSEEVLLEVLERLSL